MQALAILLAALYGAAILVLIASGLHLLVLAYHAARRNDQLLPPLNGHARYPRVTVQIPLYNEAAVAARVVDAVAAMDYPRDSFEVQVLDDSTDGTPAIVEERVRHWSARGVRMKHVRRDDRVGYKAGALASGARRIESEYVAIFDADFVPQPDFLRRAIPHFTSDEVGMVQARWGHLNAEESALTRAQAFGLDAHFSVEQAGRSRAGAFMSFNGTAGIWRWACIESSGGWSADTLAEDLDLSYRAQLAGWRFRYVHDLAVPAELPPTMAALRTQQYRWTKGAVETARKLLGNVWSANLPMKTRLLAGLHLTAHAAFPALLLAAFVHAPLMLMKEQLASPAYFAALSAGLIGFIGFAAAHIVAQRRIRQKWLRRQTRLPMFMIGGIGMALHNTLAFIDGLRGKRTPFLRTPKFGFNGHSATLRSRLPRIVWMEIALATYSAIGLVLLISAGRWEAVPFQLAFLAGFAAVSLRHVLDLRQGGEAPAN
jgi:cellulose synthase/poly-beta-1,6-N-acetylglucosamine synthase-like glycosyltransferase